MHPASVHALQPDGGTGFAIRSGLCAIFRVCDCVLGDVISDSLLLVSHSIVDILACKHFRRSSFYMLIVNQSATLAMTLNSMSDSVAPWPHFNT